jgi:hypothetical protein
MSDDIAESIKNDHMNDFIERELSFEELNDEINIEHDELEIEKWFKLYDAQLNLDLQGNEGNRRHVFHVLLSQLLVNKQGYRVYYNFNGTLKPTVLHFITIQESRSGKGTIMKNAVKLYNDCMNAVASNSKAEYYAVEPTVQHLQGGIDNPYSDKTNNPKASNNYNRNKVVRKKGILETHKLLAFGEGNVLLNPTSSFGNFKNLMLEVCDEEGRVIQTARKDSSDDGMPYKYNVNTSIMAGSVFTKNIREELINSGLIQRFLFNWHKTSKDEFIEQMLSRCKGLEEETLDVQKLQDARIKFIEHYKDCYENDMWETGVVFTKEAAQKLFLWIKNKAIGKVVGDEFNEVYKSLVMSTQLHIERVAVLAAALEHGNVIKRGEVGKEHVAYAIKHCAPVLEKYIKLYELFFVDGFEGDDKIRVTTVLKIISRSTNKRIKKTELVQKCLDLKRMGLWDKGANNTTKFINNLLMKKKIFEISGEEGNTKYITFVRQNDKNMLDETFEK